MTPAWSQCGVVAFFADARANLSATAMNWGSNLMQEIWKGVLLLGTLVACVQSLQAQTTADSTVTTSSSRMSAQAKAPAFTVAGPVKQNALPPSSAKQISSPHLFERNGPPPDEVNRKNFEDNAGEKGGKLFLRSVPSGADIFVNDLLVGRTPLIMVMAAGPYKIEMRGARDDSGHATVGVMPKETRTVEIDLKQRYPSSISLR